MVGFLGANRMPEKMLRPTTNRSVPSTAPMILFSSNESIQKLRVARSVLGLRLRTRKTGRRKRLLSRTGPVLTMAPGQCVAGGLAVKCDTARSPRVIALENFGCVRRAGGRLRGSLDGLGRG